MKKLLAIFLVSLIILAGCGTTDTVSENSIERLGDSSTVSSESSDPVGEILSQLSLFDIEVAHAAAEGLDVLHNVGIWENPEDIEADMYVIWYHFQLCEDLTQEEREKYKAEIGVKYPQEELEAYIQQSFDVSTEHLRTFQNYDSENGVYHLDYIGGANLKYTVRLSDENIPWIEGDLMYIPMELSFNGNFKDTEYRTLVIQRPQYEFKYIKVIE